ncbi:hypothetical protein JCM8547_000304 [Rhodosporidiobolus lusitaniae]
MAPTADLLVSPGIPASSLEAIDDSIAAKRPRASVSSASSSTAASGLKKPRTGKACSRCRRYRSNLTNSSNSIFQPRGQSAGDRAFRRKRPLDEGYAPYPPPPRPAAPSLLPPSPGALSSLLPPRNELQESVKAFCSSYFQLGFISEGLFLERLDQDSDSANFPSTFLLLSILTMSARFSPSLVARHGGRRAATEVYSTLAHQIAATEMLKPTVENIQSFFLLGMLLGVAVRMSGILRLHREETYALPPDAEQDEVVRSELARRTFWILVAHDNLTSTSHRPASFSFSEISTKLPSDEDSLAFGTQPAARASLAGTAAALQDPASVNLPSRPLFASMVGAHVLFGKVATFASSEAIPAGLPWEPESEYARLSGELAAFEDALPHPHCWSLGNLRGWRAKKCDLALLSLSLVLRLANIVLDRLYLPSLAAAIEGGLERFKLGSSSFWGRLAAKMSEDARGLLQQAEMFFSFRSSSEGFPPVMVFGVYAAGDLASYACRWPQLCPDLAPFAPQMVKRSLDLLSQLQDAWPLAAHWHDLLLSSSTPLSQEGMASTVANDRKRDVVEGLYRQEQDEGTSISSPPRSSIALVSPSLEMGASSLLELSLPSTLGTSPVPPAPTLAMPTYPTPAMASSSVYEPIPTNELGISIPPPSEPSADLMFFPDLGLGADLSAFLQGDAFSSGEYDPSRPFLWSF